MIAKSILNKVETFKFCAPELQVKVFCYSTPVAIDLNLSIVINNFKTYDLARVYIFIILRDSSIVQRFYCAETIVQRHLQLSIFK